MFIHPYKSPEKTPIHTRHVRSKSGLWLSGASSANKQAAWQGKESWGSRYRPRVTTDAAIAFGNSEQQRVRRPDAMDTTTALLHTHHPD